MIAEPYTYDPALKRELYDAGSIFSIFMEVMNGCPTPFQITRDISKMTTLGKCVKVTK